MPSDRTVLSRAKGKRPRLAVALQCALTSVGFCLDVLEHIGHFGRRFAEFCEASQRAVDDGCLEYEARDEEWVMRDAA